MAYMVENLSFKLSLESAKQLIPEILTSESMEQADKSVMQLLSNICVKIDDKNLEGFESSILREFLLKTSTDLFSDMTLTFDKKINIISACFACIKAMGSRAPAAFVTDVQKFFLTLLFSDNTDTTIPSEVTDVFKNADTQIDDSVSAYIETNAFKI